MEAVTYVNEKKEFRTFKLQAIHTSGCSKQLASRLRYAKSMVEKLLVPKSSSKNTKNGPKV